MNHVERTDRNRVTLGAGHWLAPLTVLLLAGVPLMIFGHTQLFAGDQLDLAPEPTTLQVYSSLDEIPQLFDPITGEPLVRYSSDGSGGYRFFSLDALVDPATGRQTAILTSEALAGIRGAEQTAQQLTEQQAREARQQLEDEQREAAARQAQNAAQQAEAAAQQAEAAFKERYVDTAAVSELRQSSAFVLVAIDNPSLESRIAAALRNRGITVRTGVLRNSVFGSDIFGQLSAGDRRLLSRLGVAGLSGHILLGRAKLEEAKSARVGNVVNRKGFLTVSIIDLARSSAISLPPLAETGAGFDAAQAQSAAEQRLVEALLEQGPVRRVTG